MHPDPAHIVAQGYDRIADRYVEWSKSLGTEARDRYLAILLQQQPVGAPVLELGCGTGSLTTARLAERFAVTGVDISRRSIQQATRNVPGATFVHADMTDLDFPPESVDAVTAFDAITHVPRERHGPLLDRIARWLRPGGLLIATMGATSVPGTVEQEGLGVRMYFSHHNAETNKRLVQDAGLSLLSAREETADEDGVRVTFLWVVAEKPHAAEE